MKTYTKEQSEVKLAEAMVLLKKANNYINHPAAPHSYATQEAGEELRDKIADFIGEPKPKD